MPRKYSRFVSAIAVCAVFSAAPAAQRKDDKKPSQESTLTQQQRQELSPVLKAIDEVMKGGKPGVYLVPVVASKDPKESKPLEPPQHTGASAALTWKNDFLKAGSGQTYIPFTLQVEPGALTSSSVAAYLRAAPKGASLVNMSTYQAIREGMAIDDVRRIFGSAGVAAAGTDAAAGGRSGSYTWSAEGGNASITFQDGVVKTKSQVNLPELAFEDVYFADLRGGKLQRALAVPPGPYDVYVGVRERAVAGTPAEGLAKVIVLKQELTVPNYHTDELQTSSIIIADKVDQLAAPVPAESQKERPYVIGDAEILPAQDNKFKKSEEIFVIFQVYGAKLEDKKPDVTVDYVFHQRDAAGAEKPFNKTPPQVFNGQSLPANFDGTAGHQIIGGQAVPLATFPEGEFRLEIKVTDNRAGKSLTRDVLFTVIPAS